MIRQLPPLNSLKAFEACARLGSFTHAAEELSVTQSAISKQVKGLEDSLGVQLFYRSPRRLELTARGRVLVPLLSEMFDRLAVVTREIRDTASHINLKLPPTFAVRWLIPRIAEFERERAEVKVHLNTTWQPVNFAKENFDAGIVCGTRLDAYDNSVFSQLITSEDLTPACSPTLLKREPLLRGPEDLLNFPLLHWRLEFGFWRLWFSQLDMPEEPSEMVHQQYYDLMDTAIHAAVQGMGVALVNPQFIRDEIAIGRLVLPFEDLKLELNGYYFVCPKVLATQPRIIAFRRWLMRADQG